MSGATTLATYSYDALGRRIVETSGGTARDLYFSAAWQVIEERVSGQTRVQYVWSPLFPDTLVERDRDPNGSGTLSERLYVQQDPNGNVTALIDANGNVVERYVYDPYGAVTVLNATWGTLSGSAYAWVYLFQGGRYDSTAGLYDFRFRGYSPNLGRWLQNDPLGFAAGDTNLYRAEGNNPTNFTDPSGLQQIPNGGPYGGSFNPSNLGQPDPYYGLGFRPGQSRTGYGGYGGSADPSMGMPLSSAPYAPAEGAVTEFVRGFFAGLGPGAWSVVEGWWQLVRHPIETVQGIINGVNELVDLVRNGQWDEAALKALKEAFPEIHELVTEWDKLSPHRKGYLVGRVVGQQGACAIGGVGLAKLIEKLKGALSKFKKVGPAGVPVEPPAGTTLHGAERLADPARMLSQAEIGLFRGKVRTSGFLRLSRSAPAG